MKKLLGGITFLLLALVLASPWFVGGQIESYYNTLIEEARQEAPQLDFSDRTYNRGWFSSTVTGTLGFNGLFPMEEMPVTVRYESRIVHGPLFWSDLASAPAGLALDKTHLWIELKEGQEVESQELVELFKAIPQFNSVSVVTFDRNIATTFDISAFTKTMDDAEKPFTIDFQGMHGTSNYNVVTKEIVFDATFPRLSFEESKDETLFFDNLVLKGSQKGLENNARYDLASFAFLSKESGIDVAMKELYIAAGNNDAGEVYNSYLDSGFQSLKVKDQSYAPAEFSLGLENLDKEALASLKKSINEAVAKSQEMGEEMMGMVIMGKVMELLPEFLKRDPKLIIKKIHLGTGKDQSLDAKGYATIDGEEAVKLMAGPMFIQAVDAEFEASLPKPFASSVIDPNRIMFLVGQNILVAKEDAYTLKAEVKKGRVTINGVPIM